MKESWDIEQEPDRVASRRLLLISALALLVALAGVLAAAQMLHRSNAAPSPRAPRPAEIRPSSLEQGSFERDERGLELRAAQRKRLEEYGWVDRGAGVVRIPIERAMELRIQEPR